MFGFGKKAKKLEGTDVLLLKSEGGRNRTFYQIAFPSIVSNDIVSMLKKLEKSPFNKQEFIGDIGGFRLITLIESATRLEVLDEEDLEAQPVDIQDFANILLRRLEQVEESGQFEDSEDLAFFMGELTMLRDGSFVPQQ